MFFGIASCGSSSVDIKNSELVANTAIELAQAAEPEAESPVLGVLPSVCLQEDAAIDSIKSMSRESMSKIEAEHESDLKAAFEEAEEINESVKHAKEIVKTIYKERILKIGEQLIGKEIPVAFDVDQYKSAKGVITKVEQDGGVKVAVTLVLAKPLVGRISDLKYITWEWQDAEGKVLSEGATTVRPQSEGLKDDVDGEIKVDIYTHADRNSDMALVKFIRRD